MIKAAARLGYQPVRRGGAPAAAAAASIGFVCDEISTDPWTAIGLDGVREKAWEHGLTVTVMATRGDADMEAAALAQLASQPLARPHLRDHQHPPHRRAGRALRGADGAAQLPRGRAARSPSVVAGRSRGRPRRDRRPHPRRPQAHRLHQRRSEHGGGAPSPERLSAGARHRRLAVRSRPRSRGQLAAAFRLRGDARR